MEVNWITVIAQIINFIILLWLLKRFLYGPLLNAMQQRQERISNIEGEALAKEKEAAKQVGEYAEKIARLEEERQALLNSARGQAEEERQAYLVRARQEVMEKRESWEAALAREKDSFIREGTNLLGQEAVRIARAVLEDLAGEELEQRMALNLLNKLKNMPAEERLPIKESLGKEAGIRLYSSFPLKSPMQHRIKKDLAKELGLDLDVAFLVNGDLVCGLELEAGGYHLGWSIADYLHNLEERLEKLTGEKTG